MKLNALSVQDQPEPLPKDISAYSARLIRPASAHHFSSPRRPLTLASPLGAVRTRGTLFLGGATHLHAVEALLQAAEALLREVEAIFLPLEARLQAVEARLQAVEFHLQPVEVRLQPLEFRLQLVEVRLQPLEFRLQLVEVRLHRQKNRLQAVEERLQRTIRRLFPRRRALRASKPTRRSPMHPRP